MFFGSFACSLSGSTRKSKLKCPVNDSPCAAAKVRVNANMARESGDSEGSAM